MLSLFKKAKIQKEHPAFEVGKQMGKRFSEWTIKIANYLNIWQYQIGFRVRNALILSILVLLFGWFIWQLSTVFN
ncbi:MAG: hypothetical protein EAZ70_07005 [Runella slithyformis]|jgi:hypothetical protein|nr:MAG: hypothetical protein EAY79_06365 [Runella slithyformis]TAE99975.1 MAG: hypothetical protein EAZ80_04280 [Runella slithyformis]TAF27548.1 MAG: hypothetical protein EAZ70_07005 [Runella slithyformis]TAF46062.1 MAG: hypothetical protein EAZ63_09965 [Runella slithyformis]TAF82244.1 MAG: hypothetical protein EAZ50_04405 [Runella slithyformis]